MSIHRPALVVLALAFVPAACGGDGPAAQTGGLTAEHRASAKRKFETLCFTCHGTSGKGDGPGSTGLVPQPRDFTDPTWQASVTDEHIEKIIVGGGLAVGKAATMPPNPDLKSRPQVVMALREYIRGLNPSK